MGNLQILKDAYEAFGRGDVPSVLAIFDPNIEWREAEGNPYKPDGKPWIGSDAIVQHLFTRLGSEWDGFTLTPRRIESARRTLAEQTEHSSNRSRPAGHAFSVPAHASSAPRGGRVCPPATTTAACSASGDIAYENAREYGDDSQRTDPVVALAHSSHFGVLAGFAYPR